MGNPRALCRNRLWNHLLIHFREKGCLVDGPLDNLQLSMVQLNTNPTKPGGNFKSRPKFGAASTVHSSTDFDSASVVSYDNTNTITKLNNELWPALNGNLKFSNDGYHNNNGTNNHLVSNFTIN